MGDAFHDPAPKFWSTHFATLINSSLLLQTTLLICQSMDVKWVASTRLPNAPVLIYVFGPWACVGSADVTFGIQQFTLDCFPRSNIICCICCSQSCALLLCGQTWHSFIWTFICPLWFCHCSPADYVRRANRESCIMRYSCRHWCKEIWATLSNSWFLIWPHCLVWS